MILTNNLKKDKMRVISGLAKGTRLKAPHSRKVRPTSDRVKEALFNILQFEIEGRRVLDLYAGSGSLGIEALSRGATLAVFVEQNADTIKFLKENLKNTYLDQGAIVYNLLVESFFDRERKYKNYFDLIFIDPPYKIKPENLSIIIEKAAKFLRTEGVMVVEHRAGMMIEYPAQKLYLADKRTYGDTSLRFFKLLRQ